MALDDKKVLAKYRRCMQDAEAEHKRILKDVTELYKAYGLKSFADFGDLRALWGDNPPEVGILLSSVNTFWGSLMSSRREPAFPGFDLGTGDAVLGEALTQLLKACRRHAGSDAVDQDVVLDAILTGYGFARQALETETRPPFRPSEEYVSADRIWFDPGGHGQNRGESQEWIIRDHFSLEEAEARFPDHEDTWAALRLFMQPDGAGGDGASQGAHAVISRNVQVSISSVDGTEISPGRPGGRLREVPIDDFQYKHVEAMAGWYGSNPETGQQEWQEMPYAEWDEGMKRQEAEAELTGMPFERPRVSRYVAPFWYRCPILAATGAGQPKVLASPEPIKGNQRLVRAMTGYVERYKPEDGEGMLRTRHFGFGRVLVGLQQLFSVALRIYVEQEARRNRDGWDGDDSAFGGDEKAKREFLESRSIPGSVYFGPDGWRDKIQKRDEQPKAHTTEAQQMFRFLAGDLPAYSLGVSDVSRGTFTEDRSAKFITAIQQSALQMQTVFTQAYTAYLDEGAVTMARLCLDILDAVDIDRLLGEQPLREGITGQRDESGQLAPIMTTDEETGEEVPMTIGRYLKANQKEIMDYDVAFGLRPSAATERLSNAALMIQHGFIGEIANLLDHIPEAKEILAPLALRGSFAEGSTYADAADQLEALLKKRQQQMDKQASVATDDGWLAYVAEKAGTDFEGAVEMMKRASAAVTSPNQEGGAANGNSPVGAA